MSAIAGVLAFGEEPVDQPLLHAIARPAVGNRIDALSFWTEKRIGLGHALARVTPESFQEQQPLVDSASGCVITFDGRIDNRDELRSSIRDRLELLSSESDAAYVLGAYLVWDTDLVTHLLGDFAFAIWDPRSARLLLARDPMGQRTLFYSHSPNQLVFASTLEQLLQAPTISRAWDEQALPAYFYRYSWVGERTIYRDIKSLSGGSYALVEADRVTVECYWHLPKEPPTKSDLTSDDVAEFRHLFAQAVRCRLRSQRPVGLLLSGGLDSNAIACMASHLQLAGHFRAYSSVYDQFESCDERTFIRATLSRYELAHTPIASDDCWTLARLEQFLPVFSEPSMGPFDASLLKALECMRADGLAAVMTGHGGDSILSGSRHYLAEWMVAGRWRDVNEQVRAYCASTGRPYPMGFASSVIVPLLPARARELIEYRHWPAVKPLVPSQLYSQGFQDRPRLPHGRHAWWQAYREEFAFGLTPHEAHLDRIMRLCGMEPCNPFLDVRLVNFMVGLPPHSRYYDGTTKHILRVSLHDILPPAIRDRKTKTSVQALTHYGLRERRRAFVQALLQDSELGRRQYVNPIPWQNAIQAYLDRKGKLSWVYWYSLNMEMWMRYHTGRLPPLE